MTPTLSRAQYNSILARNTTDAPLPRRKKVGTGTLALYKQWLAAMGREPGIFMPIRLIAECNNRDNRWEKNARKKRQQETVALAFRWRRDNTTLARLRVVLTRYGPKRLDDDNLRSAAKGVRDQIARIIGVDDGSAWYQWEYDQVQTKRGQYGFRVLCYGTEASCPP